MIRKNLLRLSKYHFSATHQPPNASGTKIQPPEIQPYELEPFKFQQEREQLMYGYTMEELYGKKYGITHSYQIKVEMIKDNVLLALFFFGGIYLAFQSRDTQFQLNQDYKNYVYHDMNTVRPIPDHVE